MDEHANFILEYQFLRL